MSLLAVSKVWKSFPKKPVLRNIDIEIKKGEFATLFGPNGCGKTTLLNLIAGILEPDKGDIAIDNKLPQEQVVGYVFQNYRDSLLPWRTNLENIAFPLELQGVAQEERARKVKKLVRSLELKIPLHNYPYQSSGGEQQLVAFLREIITQPKLILMDEPFSSLDAESRAYLRVKIQEISEKMDLTILFVSHDIDETIQLGDTILLFDAKKRTIAKKLSVTLGRPRTEEIIYTEPFHRMKKILQRYEE